MLSRRLDRHGQDSQHEGPSEVRAAPRPPLPTNAQGKEAGGQPREMETTPQTQVPTCILVSNHAVYFLWQENLFIWGKRTHSING